MFPSTDTLHKNIKLRLHFEQVEGKIVSENVRTLSKIIAFWFLIF